MSSKRSLKKRIKYICGDIAGECLFSEMSMAIDGQKMSQIIVDLADLQDDTINKISFSYVKSMKEFENEKEYNKAHYKYNKEAYRVLKEQFNNRLKEIVKEINALIPAEIKDDNKTK